jgi:MraZ protein
VGNNGALWVIVAVLGIPVNKMSDAKPVLPTYYNSCFRHGVDEKRRVQIPAKWRPEDVGTELTVILWPKHNVGACLRVLPPEKMAKLVADIDALPNSDPNKSVLKRRIGSKSAQVVLDKAGRICLPEDMARSAEIKGEAMLVGLLTSFEIWNPARYENVEAADEVHTPKAFEFME